MTGQKPLIFVTVGTDHHPFDRLIEWADRWVESREGRARVFVQSGTSRPPRSAEGKPYLSHQEMRGLLSEATAVVCHGGPGTIMEARRAGLIPVVVPRQAGRGEHVDDHQPAFAARLAAAGEILVPKDESQLHEVLDQTLRDPGRLRGDPAASGNGSAAAGRVERLVEDLVAEDRAAAPPVRVLYVGGVGRSGTTVLDRMLGQVPGVCSLGEVVHLWLRGLFENDLCGCGRPFRTCEFWSEVGKEAYGGWDQLDPRGMVDLKYAVDRHRFIPFMLAPAAWPSFRRDLGRYSQYLSQLYRAIQKVSGASLIVDSSKHAPFAFILRQVEGVDLRIVHLIRHSNGVAYSWTKRVRRPEVTAREAYMATYGPARMAGRWVAFNLLFEGLRRLGIPTLGLRYEDLVQEPRQALVRILRFAGHPFDQDDLGFVGDDWIELGEGHNPSGNPMRFEQGRIPFRLDEEWRRKMPADEQAAVARITAPLLRRYGYRP